MATIINKRKHTLECNGVRLGPGENQVDDELWSKANSDGSQLKQWGRLGWVAERKSLPVSKEPLKSAPTFRAPSVDSPVSQEPGGTMNPSAGASEADESKRRRK